MQYLVIILFSVLITFSGCSTRRPDPEALKTEIIELHQAFIDAHLNKDVDFILDGISDDYLSVARGEITRQTKADMRENFEDYLYNTEFSEYRDVEEPVVSISDDGSMAWSVVKVKVAGRRKTDDGSENEFDFICAWISVYEKQENEWIIVTEVSTFVQ
ncbi:MAG: nuclear transport factor 2 family protein [bacterium]|nr:nuclear transport factor 2 family protein [bacterium]